MKNKPISQGGGSPPVWKLGYTIYHFAGALHPGTNRNPKYAQLYFYDPDEALHYQMQQNNDLNQDIMQYLQNMLIITNCYKPIFFHAFKILEKETATNISI